MEYGNQNNYYLANQPFTSYDWAPLERYEARNIKQSVKRHKPVCEKKRYNLIFEKVKTNINKFQNLEENSR